MTTITHTPPTVQEQAGIVLPHLAGYVAHRGVAIGLRSGLLAALADAESGSGTGLTPGALADRLGLDPFYVAVWCRAMFAAGICERDGTDLTESTYRLAPHMATLLLDDTSPAYVGGTFRVLEQPEMFDRFEANLATGERLWWDECSPDFITGVSGTGSPFYTRLVPGGLQQVPGLEAALTAGARILDTACGTGRGLVRLATTYPDCTVEGADGDAHSIASARQLLRDSGLGERVSVHVSPLEELRLPGRFTLITNNISMHECRDADAVADRVWDLLKPGGWFVISDFPFPDTDDGLRSVPGRVMTGIQFFEAQIDDQLLPRSAYDDLLRRHGFTGIGWFSLTPMHAVTYGRRPA